MAEREREEDEREGRRERRESRRDELIEEELKALDDVMEAIEHLDGASQMRVLRAAEALLPPVTTVTVTR